MLALSKVLTLMGYNQNFFIFHPILMKLGEVVVPVSISTLESANTLALCQTQSKAMLP